MSRPVWPLSGISLGAKMTVLGFVEGLFDVVFVPVSQAVSGYTSPTE